MNFDEKVVGSIFDMYIDYCGKKIRSFDNTEFYDVFSESRERGDKTLEDTLLLPFHLLLLKLESVNLINDDERFQKYLYPSDSIKFLGSFYGTKEEKEYLANIVKEWLDLDFFSTHNLIKKYDKSLPCALSDNLKRTSVQNYYMETYYFHNYLRQLLAFFSYDMSHFSDTISEEDKEQILTNLNTVEGSLYTSYELQQAKTKSINQRIKDIQKKEKIRLGLLDMIERKLRENKISDMDQIKIKQEKEKLLGEFQKYIDSDLSLSVDFVDQILHRVFSDNATLDIPVSSISEKMEDCDIKMNINKKSFQFLKKLSSFSDDELNAAVGRMITTESFVEDYMTNEKVTDNGIQMIKKNNI